MSATTDELGLAISQLTFNTYHNAPIGLGLINTLQDVATQLSPGPPLDELNAAISQLQWAAPNAAPANIGIINQLTDVSAQLTFGTQNSNPPDAQAIAELEQEILLQEPDWAPLLWVNWDGVTTLTVHVTGLATLTMVLSETPWWTHWDNFYDAASQIIASIYLMQLAGPPSGFDQNYSSPDMTVSADAMSATRTQMLPSWLGASATSLSALSAIGQVYAEIKINEFAPGNIGVGIAISSLDVTDINVAYVGGPGSIGLYDNGEVVTNNTSFGSGAGPTFVTGNVIGVALDCIALTVQFRNVTQSGAWSTAFSISALGPPPCRLGVTVYQVGESCSANFTGPFIGTPLSGFGPWFTPASMRANNGESRDSGACSSC